jgi:hypothetical protein
MATNAPASAVAWLRRLALLAAVAQLVLPCAAKASTWRRLAPSITSFTTDGERYAAWQPGRDAAITVLDTLDWHVTRVQAPGCELADQRWHAEKGLPAARGRFLLGCGAARNECADALLDARSGALTALPKLGCLGPVWQAVGSHYVEGEDRGSKCRQSARERSEQQGCLALYDLATGAVTDRSRSQAGDLDRPGDPRICRGLRARVVSALELDYQPSAVYKDGLFAEPGAPLGLYGCHGGRRLLSPGGEDPELGGGLVSWDTGSSDYAAEEEAFPESGLKPPAGGELFTYDLATRRRHRFTLPRTSIALGRNGGRLAGPFGYSNHTADAVFWIAATRIEYGEAFATVTSHAVYVAKLPLSRAAG